MAAARLAALACARRRRRSSTRCTRSADDADPVARELAAYVLGQLGAPLRTLPAEQAAALERMAAREHDPQVLAGDRLRASATSASRTGQGWLLGPRGHADPAVREARRVRARRPRRRGRARRADRALARRGRRVRDWATFALGTLADQDSRGLRDALVARLDDPDQETRLEAVHGLALRGDPRAVEPARDLLAAHERETDSVWTRHLLRRDGRAPRPD